MSGASLAAVAAPESKAAADAAELRDGARRTMEEDGLTQAMASRLAGIPYGTYTAWLSGAYDNAETAEKVRRWLQARIERGRTRSRLPVAPRFLLTPRAERILAVLQHAQFAAGFSVIAGGPGVGKTEAVRHYAETNPNVWVVTLRPSIARLNGVLLAVCGAMKINERNPSRLSDEIIRKARGSGGLLAIDEAQHAETKALDELRSIRDAAEIGLALLGNEDLYGRMGEEGRKPAFAQMFSRVGMRLTHAQIRPTDADITMLCDAWEASADEHRLLRVIARKPGALRAMTMTLKLAGMLASGADTPRSAQHIRDAWSQLSINDALGSGSDVE